MKKLRYVLVALAASLLLAMPAYAAEMGEEYVEPVEDVNTETVPEEESAAALLGEEAEDESGLLTGGIGEFYFEGDAAYSENVSLFEGSWDPKWTTYGEQLTGQAKEIYDEFETRFANNGASGITYGQLNSKYCASITMTFPAVVATVNNPNNQDDAKSARNKAIVDAYGSAIENAIYAFCCDYPEYFWIRSSYVYYMSYSYTSWRQSGTSYICDIKDITMSIGYVVYYSDKGWESDAQSVNTVANQIVKECEDLPVVARLAYFDNWLAKNNAYNSYAAEESKKAKEQNYDVMSTAVGPFPWNVSGALLEKYSPVCEGYAKAFQLLCHKIGVPCVTVSSSGHMWNMVQIDRQWYHMDCTWNDPVVSGGTVSSYDYSTRKYFLISAFTGGNDTGIGGDHVIRQDLIPPTAAASNYFASTAGWSMNENGIAGYMNASSTGKYWMALYNDGKMLGLLPCVTIPWGSNRTRVLAPEFSSTVLNQAKSGKGFLVADETTWKPVEASSPFSK